MQCVPPSKQASSPPQSQGNLEFRNPMSGRRWRRGRVAKPDLVSKDRTAPTGYQPIRLVDRPRARPPGRRSGFGPGADLVPLTGPSSFLWRHGAQIGDDGAEIGVGHASIPFKTHGRLEVVAILADALGDGPLDFSV